MDLASLKDLKLSRAERSTATALQREGMLNRVLEIGNRLEPLFSGRDVWKILSPLQRESVGRNFKEAYARHGSIEMWMTASKQPDRLRAVIELAEMLFAALPGELLQMKRAVGMGKEPLVPEDLPRWDRVKGELWFRGRLARRIARVGQAINCVRLLDAFQKAGWPTHIDNPLDFGKLSTTVNSLKKGLTIIEFHADGTGEGVTWNEL